MEDQVWFSIIIPHYNTPAFLRFLLDSIGAHRDVQVIVVDDHSDQYPEELAKCREDYRHVLFLNSEPGTKGAGAARNAGLSRVEGKWLLFADADDAFLPGCHDIVSDYRESEADLVFFKPESRKEDGTASKRHLIYSGLVEGWYSHRYGSEERLRYRFSVPWSKLIRTEIVMENNIRFDEIRYSNDVMFSAKAGYYAGKISADRRTIYCVTERKGSLTDDSSGEVYLKRMRVICERETYLRSRLPKDQMNACRRISYVFSVKDAFQNGQGITTAIELWKLFREYRLPFFSFSFRRYGKSRKPGEQ